MTVFDLEVTNTHPVPCRHGLANMLGVWLVACYLQGFFPIWPKPFILLLIRFGFGRVSVAVRVALCPVAQILDTLPGVVEEVWIFGVVGHIDGHLVDAV